MRFGQKSNLMTHLQVIHQLDEFAPSRRGRNTTGSTSRNSNYPSRLSPVSTIINDIGKNFGTEASSQLVSRAMTPSKRIWE
jgi:hypothetical protein